MFALRLTQRLYTHYIGEYIWLTGFNGVVVYQVREGDGRECVCDGRERCFVVVVCIAVNMLAAATTASTLFFLPLTLSLCCLPAVSLSPSLPRLLH